jgi:SAM-dependent methyltransferase
MTLAPSYFAEVYQATDDPWGFRTRWYESRKRALTMAALPRQRYRRGFEPGCSNGMLSAQLARRCDTLLSTDVNPRAVAAAKQRLASFHNVQVKQQCMPDDWPVGLFDLIVLSEIAYYFDREALRSTVRTVQQSLDTDGTVLLCHWRHPVPDYPLTGDEVHAIFAQELGLSCTARHIEGDFILDVWCDDATSVATREGLA